MKTVLKNTIIIFPREEKLLPGMDILLEGGLIRSILPVNRQNPENAEIIDCSGKYVMPGLIDAHYHILHGEEDLLELNLAFGITALRNVSGNQPPAFGVPAADCALLKKEIAAGKRVSPAIVNTSRTWDGESPIHETSRSVTTGNMVNSFLEEALREGAEQIVAARGLDNEIFDSVVEAARLTGLKIAGEFPDKVLNTLFLNQAHTLDQGCSLKPENLEHMLRTGVVWVPALMMTRTVLALSSSGKTNLEEDNGSAFIGQARKTAWEQEAASWGNLKDDSPLRPLLEGMAGHEQRVRQFLALGGEPAAGTGYPSAYSYPGWGVHREMQVLGEAGASPWQALRAGTINAARALDREDRKGTVEIGKDADLLILSRNPLEDLQNTLSIDSVVLRGIVHRRSELDGILEKAGMRG